MVFLVNFMMENLRFTLSRFARDDSGAVTVDWIMLAAATVLLGTPVVALVSGALDTNAASLSADLDAISQDEDTGSTPWEAGQWEMNNPGIYDSSVSWMSGFSDENLLAHMNNQEQYSEAPVGSGHPVDTYHDEYWIARDEAISRGLVDPNA